MLIAVNLNPIVRSVTLVIAFLSLLTSCVALKPQAQWQPNELPLSYAQNSLVLVLLSDQLLRKKYEAAWVLALRNKGIKAGPSYAVFDDVNSISGKTLAPFQASHQVDTLLVASVSLLVADDSSAMKDLTAYLENQLNLGADVFMQQVENVSVQVSAFSLADESLRWQSIYHVPVIGQGFDWQAVVPSAVDLLMQAGLSPPPKPKKEKAKPEDLTKVP